MPKANPLIGYAFLKTIFDEEKRNALDLCLPLLRRALHGWNRPQVLPSELQDRVEKVWGITIPQHVVEYLLPRLQALGCLSWDAQKDLYRPIKQVIDALPIDEKESAAREVYQRVIASINHELIASGYSGRITAKEVLERFLDTGTLAFLSKSSYVSHTPDSLDAIAIYLVGRLLTSIDTQYSNKLAEDIATLVMGEVLYQAITFASESESFDIVGGRMDGVAVYLDTQLVLAAAGMVTNKEARATNELIQLCRSTGCRVRAFNHTLNEAVTGARAVAAKIAHGEEGYGPVYERFFEEGLSLSDMLEDIGEIQSGLAEQGIDIDDDEGQAHGGIQDLDLKYLSELIEQHVQHKNPAAKAIDVRSLQKVFKLRNELPASRLEKCRAVLITSNKGVVRAADIFFRYWFKNHQQNNYVQLCMTDAVFATRIWLKSPTEFRDVPKNQVIAHALGSLVPREEVWARFQKFLMRLVETHGLQEHDILYIRASRLTQEALVLETMNEPASVNEKVGESVVGRVLAERSGEIEERKRLEEKIREQDNIIKAGRDEREHMDNEIAQRDKTIKHYEEELARLSKVPAVHNFIVQQNREQPIEKTNSKAWYERPAGIVGLRMIAGIIGGLVLAALGWYLGIK